MYICRPQSAFRPRLSRLRRLPLPPAAPDWTWAEQEFGHAQLGDTRRTQRLVRIAAQASHQPAATVAQIFANAPDERQTAYDFFENEDVPAFQIARAHHQATARRSLGERFVFLAVDGGSLQYDDPEGERGMGRIGTNKNGAKGLKTMLGLAISPQGVPLGLLGQAFWTRDNNKRKPHASRPISDKETRYWHDVISQAQSTLDEVAPDVVLWPQLDREGDSWSLILDAVENAQTRWITVRARCDRKLVSDPDGEDQTEPGGKLRAALESQTVQATWELDVIAGSHRKGRRAHMTLRWREVTLLLRDPRTGRQFAAPIYALLAREEGTTPPGEKPIEWLLLTTHAIENAREAFLVLFGYSQRWRIEQLHAAIKDRGCRLEECQMEERSHVERFVTVMLAVGVRLVRLSYLYRVQPEQPATIELTENELQALLWSHGYAPDQWRELTIDEAVVLLGLLGGHIGNPDKRPIGFKILTRGLRELRPVVRLIRMGCGP